MSRYIDAEWLMEYFKRGKEYKGEYVLDDLKYDAPSIDIVRCKECKYGGKRNDADIECKKHKLILRLNDYCSYGEREGE